jgi:predicted GNAT family N-acyltransferase
MVLVNKEHRGNGLSKLLLAALFEKLQEFTSIKLDATPQGEPVYKKFDFKNEYSIARMVNMTIKPLLPGDNNCTIEPVQLQDLQEIIALDQRVFGANRANLIQYLVNEYPARARLLKQQDRITSFILGRDGCRYHHIGPLMAATTNQAKILITNALQHLIHQAVVLDVPYDKAGLISWLTTIGFTQQRHFTRMYKKENPLPGIPAQQYLICGPEFG